MTKKPYQKTKNKMKKKVKDDDDDHLLPLGLIESEILAKLPAKFVGRCRCVCKQWRSSLSTHSFAMINIANNNDYKLLSVDDESKLRTLPNNILCNPNPDCCGVYILATLDGLVCLESKSMDKRVFWNPLTGAYRKLRNPDFPIFSYSFLNGVGFYKDSTNDYKLVCVIAQPKFVYEAYVYSNRLDRWRKIDFSIGVGSNTYYIWSAATFNDQCLYFNVKEKFGSRDSWVLCFDVETETFRRIEFPHVPKARGPRQGSLVLLNGCMHLFVYYTTHRVMKLGEAFEVGLLKQGELWKMDAGDGWVKVGHFDGPLGEVLKEQRICTASYGNWVIVLDEEDNSLKKMTTEDFTRQYWYFCSPSLKYRSSRMMYVESLVSPNP